MMFTHAGRRVLTSLSGALRSASSNVAMRQLHSTSGRFDARAAFDRAQKELKTLTEDPGNEVKLKLYALFKQSTLGQCTGKRPSMIDFVGRAKHDAWAALGDMSQDAAMDQYANTVAELRAAEGGDAPNESAASDSAAVGKMPNNEIVVTKENGVCHIKLNRPKKKNALTPDVCFLAEFFTGYVAAYIDHPKPLVALVHGPAIGVSVTVLGLFDLVFASDRATFHTPFASLGQTPEGTSAFVFPRIMGLTKASEVLLFGKKLTAEEACRRNLVTEVIPIDEFETECWRRINAYAKLPPQSLRYCKEMIRATFKDQLHQVNQAECDRLEERWQSTECANAIMEFFSRSKM